MLDTMSTWETKFAARDGGTITLRLVDDRDVIAFVTEATGHVTEVCETNYYRGEGYTRLHVSSKPFGSRVSFDPGIWE